jgi:RNA ligase
MNKINIDNLNKMIDEGFITKRKHPTENLYIYNYSQKAQFDHVWNNETLQCRGLIMDENNNIIARPFSKFFNLEELEGQGKSMPIEDFEIFDKEDGSLGILYWVNDKPYLATRGSFESEQAIKGTEILQKKYGNIFDNHNFTYLFEIIFPQNRIVLDYGKMEDIILLAIIDTKTGQELEYSKVLELFNGVVPIVKRYDAISDYREFIKQPKVNKEGYVIRFKSGMRVKAKFEEYVRLHRLITGVTARRIWDLLKNKQSTQELLERVPEEFSDWVSRTISDLEASYEDLYHEANKTFQAVKDLPSRKEQAKQIFQLDKDLYSIVFKMLDNKPYDDIIWKMLRPEHEKPFKIEI